MKNSISEKFSVGFFLYRERKKKILLHKRDDKPTIASPNKWDYFGGSGEKRETIKEAVLRELSEELGVRVKVGKIKALRDYCEEGIHQYIFYIISSHKTQEFKLGEGAGFAWFSLSEALKLDLTEDARKNLSILSKEIN